MFVTAVPGHWFLHVARFPGRTDSEREFLVSPRGSRHVYGIQFWVFEKLIDVGVKPGNIVALGEVFGSILVATL